MSGSGDIIDVDEYVPRNDWQCPICHHFSIGEEARIDHLSRCRALLYMALRRMQRLIRRRARLHGRRSCRG